MTDVNENSKSTPTDDSINQHNLIKQVEEDPIQAGIIKNNSNDSSQPQQVDETKEQKEGQKIINKENVEKQVIINEVQKLIITSKEKKHEEKFEDPTKPFEIDTNNILKLEDQLLDECCQQLEKDRILIVNSFDVGTLSLFPSTLLVNRQLMVSEKRILFFKGNNLTRQDLSVDTLVYQKIGKGNHNLLIIHLFDSGAQYFIDSLFECNATEYIKYIKRELNTKGRMLLILIERKLFLKTFKEKKEDFAFPPKYIDFLSHVLKKYHYSVNDIKKIQVEINQQRNQGLWGKSDIEFYDHVIQYLRNHEFDEQIKARKDKDAYLKNMKGRNASALIEDDDPIKKKLLYTAAFFQGISHYEFDIILNLLLGTQKSLVQEKMIKTNEKGEKELVEIPAEVLLKETYRRNADKMLKECCLKVTRNDDGARLVTFSTANLKDDVKTYLENNHFSFLTNQFQIIQDSALFFDPKASLVLLEEIINLFVEMFSSEPERYGKSWLFRIVSTLRQDSQSINVDIESTGNEYEFLEQVLAQLVEKEKIHRLVFDRLADLLREMLNHLSLKGMVDTFLEQLISAGEHEITLRLVLGLAQRLRFAPHFNQLYWLKQLLDRGDKDTRDNAYGVLLREAKQSNIRIYEFLSEVKSWLPEHDRPVENYSMSNGYALRFLIDYSYLSVANLNNQHYGHWPSKYSLFANLDVNSASVKFEILVSWLFHPGLRYFENEGKENAISSIIGKILLDWSSILVGYGENSTNPEAKKIFDIFMKKISESDKKQQKEVLKFWVKEFSSCRTKISSLSMKDKELRKELKCLSNMLNILIRQFKQ